MRTPTILLLLALAGCGDDSGPSGSGSTVGSSSATGVDAGTAGSGEASTSGDASSGTATTSDPETSSSDGTSSNGSDPTASSDTQGGVGPVELYRGSVDGGIVPGWNPDAPRPLVMMGRLENDWVATLARLDAGGNLSENVSDEIIVWGFDVDPPVVYDGPVGGTIEGWNASAPDPVVAMGYRESDDSWFATLLSVTPDGTIGDNTADRIIVWGWSGAEPSAPTLAYEGAVGGQLDAWNAQAPDPIVGLGTPGLDLWLATLVRIAPDGTLSDNTAASLRLWRW